MSVDSYLELFTTMYGWAFANIIGEALTGTGLLMAPFCVIAFQIWRDAKESGASGAGAVGLSDAVQVRLLIAIFVFTFAFAVTPFTTLGSSLNYTPQPTADNPNPSPVSLGNTGSSYDVAMSDYSTLGSTETLDAVPMWWYLVMSISSGINDSVRAGLTNSAPGLSEIEALARMAAIEDPHLRADIQRFYNECYLKARSRYLNLVSQANPGSPGDNTSPGISDAGQAILSPSNTDGYGPTDVDWMGSYFFQTEPGFYPSMRSYNPVPGFQVDPNRDVEYAVADNTTDPTVVAPDWGRPTCLEWWTDSANGLRTRIVGDSTTTTQLSAVANQALTWSSDGQREDAVAKAAVIKSPPDFVDPARIMGDSYSGFDHVVMGASGGVGTLFTGMSLGAAFMAFNHMVNALPMFQAVLLMCIYMLLPVIVVLSGYRLEMMFYGAMGIFIVKFWTVLWFVAQWFDSHIWAAMYPGSDGNMILHELVYTDGPKRIILKILSMAMFITFPMIFSAMMGWIGIRIGSQLSDFMQNHAHVANNKTGMHVPTKIPKSKPPQQKPEK